MCAAAATALRPEHRDLPVPVLVIAGAGRAQLVDALAAEPAVAVRGAVDSLRAARAWLRRDRAEVALIGDDLPDADGFDVARALMETAPLPVVMCADPARSPDAADRASRAGAAACVGWPPAPAAAPDAEPRPGAHLAQTLRLMAEIPVVQRRASAAQRAAAPGPAAAPRPVSGTAPRMVGIGASTGGPLALQSLLAALPAGFALPILVVQHISPGFLPGLARWLGQSSALPLHIAEHGLAPQPGHVYLAPDGMQMGLSAEARIALARPPQRAGGAPAQPTVAHLFHSLAQRLGPAAIGVLLTGMGKDGAREIRQMRQAGAVTIVQDSASSAVHGMAGEAIALGGAIHVLPPRQIAGMLLCLTARPPTPPR